MTDDVEPLRAKIRSLAKAWIQDPEIAPRDAVRIVHFERGFLGHPRRDPETERRKAVWEAAARQVLGDRYEWRILVAATGEIVDVAIGRDREPA